MNSYLTACSWGYSWGFGQRWIVIYLFLGFSWGFVNRCIVMQCSWCFASCLLLLDRSWSFLQRWIVISLFLGFSWDFGQRLNCYVTVPGDVTEALCWGELLHNCSKVFQKLGIVMLYSFEFLCRGLLLWIVLWSSVQRGIVIELFLELCAEGNCDRTVPGALCRGEWWYNCSWSSVQRWMVI